MTRSFRWRARSPVAELELTLPLLWSLVLGLDLAWAKGSFGIRPHVWVGVRFHITPSGTTMELPAPFLQSARDALEPLCSHKGNIPIGVIRTAIGKSARIAYVVPRATPFVASLWGGLAGGMLAAKDGKPGTNANRLPARRFTSAARWLRRLIAEALGPNTAESQWILKRRMEDSLPLQTGWSIASDASPWGGGGVLWHGGKAIEYCHFTWSDVSLQKLGATTGDPDFQTHFEFFALYLCLFAFEAVVIRYGVHLGGDNLSSLNMGLNLKSRSPKVNDIARVIAWRQALRKWRFRQFHFPAELNVAADGLPRLQAVPPMPRPSAILKGAHLRSAPIQDESLWLARHDVPLAESV